MGDTLTFWVLLTLACIFVQSFFSMLEMAMVSFNKVRLQYYVSKGMHRARWIDYLLQNPSRLFGTTLLGVNIALQIGSECSRNVYINLGLDPDIAPLTQVFLVMIFAELAPMFAARRFAEHVAMLGIPIIYATSKIMMPAIWVIGGISKAASYIFGNKKGTSLSALSREELQHVVEEHGEAAPDTLSVLVNNIFTFRQHTARDAMTPLSLIRMLSWKGTVEDLRQMLSQYDVPCIPIYYQGRENIVSIALPRDLVAVKDRERVRDHARPPWFITQSTPLMQILKQFRHNNQEVAVVLDSDGLAVGLLTLDDILEEIFGEPSPIPERKLVRQTRRKQLIERTLPGEMTVEEFNQTYDAKLPEEAGTLGELMTQRLGHPPNREEKVAVEGFELIAVETTLLGAKTITVRSAR